MKEKVTSFTEYTSWGRYPQHSPSEVLTPAWRSDVKINYQLPILTYGLGRSYGDSCHNTGGTIIDSSGLNKFISFDESTGVLSCEAGVTFEEILRVFVPRGWFLPVTPGTKFVTVGGAIANDIHGKNHHANGTFGRHVIGFEVLRSDGQILWCSAESNPDYYRATIGGLGLTGLILRADFVMQRIETPFILMETRKFRSLDEYFQISGEMDKLYPYTMSWTDCASPSRFGRGIMMCGTHAPASAELPKLPRPRSITFPFDAPSWLLNRFSIRAFNVLYYHKQFRSITRSIIHYDPFFYPLDAILHWNRMYGKRGFLQYQFHVPFSAGQGVVSDIFRRIARSGEGSFLAVLKTFGDIPSPGLLSFPRPGVNLALDFPFRGASTLALLTTLDDIVAAHGGAVYPAKDARMSARSFQRFFPQWLEFSRYIDPQFSSDFWRRVSIKA